MSIRSPVFQWPAILDERGPSDDPSALLTGTARFAGRDMQVVGIRVDLSRYCTSDYRAGIIESCYQSDGLKTVLGTILEELDYIASELSDLLGKEELSIVELESGPYLIWMMPATFRV
jgi:hypothetical protein